MSSLQSPSPNGVHILDVTEVLFGVDVVNDRAAIHTDKLMTILEGKALNTASMTILGFTLFTVFESTHAHIPPIAESEPPRKLMFVKIEKKNGKENACDNVCVNELVNVRKLKEAEG